jgi:hypothetical protein
MLCSACCWFPSTEQALSPGTPDIAIALACTMGNPPFWQTPKVEFTVGAGELRAAGTRRFRYSRLQLMKVKSTGLRAA